jgi:hypothetical protein
LSIFSKYTLANPLVKQAARTEPNPSILEPSILVFGASDGHWMIIIMKKML